MNDVAILLKLPVVWTEEIDEVKVVMEGPVGGKEMRQINSIVCSDDNYLHNSLYCKVTQLIHSRYVGGVTPI